MAEKFKYRAGFHNHTNASIDCTTDPLQLIDTAAELGLNILAITDHNTVDSLIKMYSGQTLVEYAQKCGVELLGGSVELSFAEGHLLIEGENPYIIDKWLVDHKIPKRTFDAPKGSLKFKEILGDFVEREDKEVYAVIIPHPGFALMSMTLPKLKKLFDIGLVHGMEVHNGSLKTKLFRTLKTNKVYNVYHDWVEKFATKNGIPAFENSDAHTAEELANYSNKLESAEPLTGEIIIDRMRQGTIFNRVKKN